MHGSHAKKIANTQTLQINEIFAFFKPFFTTTTQQRFSGKARKKRKKENLNLKKMQQPFHFAQENPFISLSATADTFTHEYICEKKKQNRRKGYKILALTTCPYKNIVLRKHCLMVLRCCVMFVYH